MRGERLTGQLMQRVMRSMARGMLLLSLLFLAITPQGFMPGMDDNGVATFIICTPDGMVEREIPGILDTARESGEDKAASGLACPYALVADLNVPAYFGGLPPIAFARSDAVGLPRLSVTLPQRHDRPGVRAPPAMVL